MTAVSAADGARRTIEKFVSGQELLQLLDTQVVAKNPETMHSLLCATARLVAEAAASGGAAKADVLDAAVAQCSIPDLVFTTPWGKFSLMLLDEMLVLTSAKAVIKVPCTAIKRVAILDRLPKDNKERVVIFIVLDKAAGVMSGKQRLESLVLQVLATNTIKVQGSANVAALDGPAPVVVCSVLGQAGVDPSAFASPDDDVYLSAEGAPALGATFKASSGWLYPLEDALYFVERPPMYFSHEDIASYELQRVHGPSITFDLVLHMRGVKATTVDFNISRKELGRLQTYLERYLQAFGSEQAAPQAKAKATAADVDGAEEEEGEEAEDEDEDEDFDPEASDDSCGPASPRPSKRARRGGAEEAGPSGQAAVEDGGDGEGESGSGGSEPGSSDDEGEEDEDDSGSVEYTEEEELPPAAMDEEQITSEKRGRRK